MPTPSDAVALPPQGVWAAAHTERAALAADLADLTTAQWGQDSLCGEWRVEEVLAHLTAAASVGGLHWLRSVIGARFDFDRHNRLRLAEQLGATPAATLERFRTIITSSTSTFGPVEAWLGEVVVHGQDICRPLGIDRFPPIDVITHLARFYARTNFTVASRQTVTGLRLVASDGPFTTGEGPLVTWPTLALVMTMTGRGAFCGDLDGPGARVLRQRCAKA